MDPQEAMTYEYRLKCRNCSLHYAVFSFDSDWDEKHAQGGFCPECGVGGVKIIWGPVPQDRPIFTFIPGDADGGINQKTGERVEGKGIRGMRMTGHIAESPFGMPQHMTEPR